MATTKEYRDFIIEQLNILDNITCRSMMGEYLLYYNGLLFGGIYDDRLLVKIVDNNKKYDMQEVIPYTNAKPMYFVEDVDSQDLLKDIVLDTCDGLNKKQE
jgi:TfoX/Sxy family transcriptional regulator of competence genes